MQNYKIDWETYKNRLIKFEYTEEQLAEAKKIRETYEYCDFQQFQLLFQQGQVERFIKLKKPRSLWVSEDGEFYFLSHYHKKYCLVGKFKE